NNLKALCEAKPKEKAPEIIVEVKEFPGVKYIGIKHTVTDMMTIGTIMEQDFQVLTAFMGVNKIEMAGPPFTRYLQWSETGGDTIIFEVCAPVKDEVKGDDHVYFGEIMPCKVAATMHFGKYEEVGSAYYAIEDYIKANALEMSGAPWESYLTDPHSEADTSKWMTEVYYPVK
ncbi:MAG: GyrI-like domain-containing protein, partial [Bacteroidetes bacterium]|nr:GyrI-like domain-containing protein [Bacteroidota bacterium]